MKFARLPFRRLIANLAGSAAIAALLTGFMLYFHIASYPYLASALVGSLVIYLWGRPGWPSGAITGLLAAAFAVAYHQIKGEPVWGSCLAFVGLGAIAALALAVLWQDRRAVQSDLEALLMASMFPLFLVVSGLSLAVTTEAHPRTYDLFLYAFDNQLGASPSFLVGRFLTHAGVIRELCRIGYEALPLAMAVAFSLDRRRSDGRPSGIMLAFTVAAAGGFILYNFYPAAGPVHVFGSQFPLASPAAPRPPFPMAPLAPAARNAMPSVHIAMALLILWNSRRWAAGWRLLAGALLAATVLATLGFGEHYLVDLLVAVPFALLAQGVAASGLAWNSPERVAAVAGGGAAVMAWLSYLRLPAPPAYGGMWAWTLLLATAVAAIYAESRLQRVEAVGRAAVPRRKLQVEPVAALSHAEVQQS